MAITAAEMGRKGAKVRWSKAGRRERTQVKDARAAIIRERLANVDGRDEGIELLWLIYDIAASKLGFTLPRLQDTRRAQTFTRPRPSEDQRAVEPPQVWVRLEEDLRDSPDDWGKRLRTYTSALEQYGRYYQEAGETDKAAQVLMVLLKCAKEIHVATAPKVVDQLSAEQLAELDAEAAAMSDEEMERVVHGVRHD
jgi:hypothetical protein